MDEIRKTLNERSQTHGDYGEVAKTAQQIKRVLHETNLPSPQREALDMIASKIARIMCGNHNEPDHWLDIEGYARLARESIK